MGCCVSSDNKDKPVSAMNISPPLSIVEEKTVVKEVLSETTLLNDNLAMETATSKIPDEDAEKKPGIAVDVPPNPVSTKSGLVEPEKGSEVSEICSLSESLLSIVSGFEEEEVKKMKTHRVRQRSPAKCRKQVMGSYSNRRTDMSPLKRNTEREGSVKLVQSGTGKRDPSERSERRSRSPAINRSLMMGPNRNQKSMENGGAMKRKSQSPGRVRHVPNKNMSEQDCRYQQWPGSSIEDNDKSTPNDSSENPLVALECFIFL